MFRRVLTVLTAMLLIASAACLHSGAAAAAVKFKFDSDKPSPDELGYAGYAAALDKTVYDLPLGAIYSKKSTTFRLWTPVASSVSVCIYKTGSDQEPGAQKLSQNPMHYSEQYGTWYLTLNGNFKNLYYTYRVTIGNQTNEVVDPYAKAVGVNGNRGMIVDLDETDPEGWAEDSFSRVQYGSEATVWEVSVRDFSADASSGVSEPNRGKFLAFTESGTTLSGDGITPTCVSYLRRLGVKYVQINPFYDFASIDESDTTTPQYNWGYDPKNYNVPEGSYASDPYDGRVRIKECKEMIQALHDSGIGVIMDVVYNHTYYSEDSFFNQIAPYYYHRINEDGTWSQGSGCGNDVATERYMVRRFIVDSVTYWAQEYHIDGFRFDLMGLMDVKTMNAVRTSLDKLPDGDRIIMYGEAWRMNTTVPDSVKLANQDNVSLLSRRIGAFNDNGRDGIKEYVTNAKSKGAVRSAIGADAGGWSPIPNQCVNYTSCHDNLTLYDELVNRVYHDKQYELRREDLVAMNKLSAAVVLMSRGMPFMLAGEEMGRTKRGDSNSYISPIEVNRIDWNDQRLYTSLVDYYSGLIKLRAAVKVMTDPTGNRSELTFLQTEQKGAVAFTANRDGIKLVAAFNSNPTEDLVIDLPEGGWVILADGERAGLTSLGTAEGTLTVGPVSAAVLIDADSYPSVASSGEEGAVYVRYVDSETSCVMREQHAFGAIDKDYRMSVPIDIAYRYDVSGDTDALEDTFDEPCRIVTLTCDEYAGKFSTVTFNYLDENDRQIADSVIISNRVGKQYATPTIPSVTGYLLDTDRLPGNGAGTVTDDPIEVVYRYRADTGDSTPDEAAGSCRINVIYMAEDGAILGTALYTGEPGDAFSLDRRSFGGYEYYDVLGLVDSFSAREANILVSYTEEPSRIWIWFAVGGAVLLLLIGAFFLTSHYTKLSKMRSIQIEE